jgi:hypothetical protein
LTPTLWGRISLRRGILDTTVGDKVCQWLAAGLWFSPGTLVSSNPFWDSKPELFSDIACLWIPYQPCIILFGNFFSGTPASNRRELRLHLNVVPTGAGVFKSRHILLHKYVNRIMITYLWRQIQLIIPSRRFRSIEYRHFDLFWKYVTWSLFPRIMWYSLFHTSCSIGIQLSMLCCTAELV